MSFAHRVFVTTRPDNSVDIANISISQAVRLLTAVSAVRSCSRRDLSSDYSNTSAVALSNPSFMYPPNEMAMKAENNQEKERLVERGYYIFIKSHTRRAAVTVREHPTFGALLVGLMLLCASEKLATDIVFLK